MPPAKRPAVAVAEGDADDEPIKQFSSQQRPAAIGSDDPICVICTKYGEYINDDTDHDVCSLECKAVDTRLSNPAPRAHQQARPADALVQPRVAETIHAKLTHYQEPADLMRMTSAQMQLILQANAIQARGSSIPHPITSFEQCSSALRPAALLRNMEHEGWAMATPVQRMAVPSLLSGRDVLVVAPGSSGKTASFVISVLAHCCSLSTMHGHKRRSGPYALILAPTRDLCVQIESTLKRVASGLQNMRTALLVGGNPVPDQLHRLRRGVQIVVGTPGRVAMLASAHPHMLRLWRMHLAVLDEADVLLQQPRLRKQTKEILDHHLAPSTQRCQTAFFSASPDMLADKMVRRLVQPITILVGQPNEKDEAAAHKATPNVKQTALWVENASKAKRLLAILDDPKYFSAPVLVFVESGLGAEYLKRSLLKRRPDWRIAAVVQHEQHSIDDRKAVIQGMNADPPAWDVVVATDTLARGIDLPRVSLVVNYDMAPSLADYIHRISRAVVPDSLVDTSKRKRGWAITFVNNDNKRLLPSFARFLSSKSSVDVTPIPNELKQLLQ